MLLRRRRRETKQTFQFSFLKVKCWLFFGLKSWFVVFSSGSRGRQFLFLVVLNTIWPLNSKKQAWKISENRKLKRLRQRAKWDSARFDETRSTFWVSCWVFLKNTSCFVCGFFRTALWGRFLPRQKYRRVTGCDLSTSCQRERNPERRNPFDQCVFRGIRTFFFLPFSRISKFVISSQKMGRWLAGRKCKIGTNYARTGANLTEEQTHFFISYQ